MVSKETKIAKCPYCGVGPKASTRTVLLGPSSETRSTKYSHPTGGNWCRFNGFLFNLTDWNDLCADIDRGRKYAAVHKKYGEVITDRNMLLSLADEAVRLLLIWRQFRFYIPGEINSEKNPRPELVPETDTFLDLPAVVKIIEEQKEAPDA